MDKSILSIVTAHNSHIEDLSMTLDSIHYLYSKFSNMESVVVTTIEFEYAVTALVKSYDFPIRVISDSGKGPFHAMNLGVSQSSGEYIWFLNSGDVISDAAEAKSFFSCLFQTFSNWAVAPARYSDTSITWKVPDLGGFKYRHCINSICHQSTFYRRNFFLSIGGLDELSSVSDWKLSLIAAEFSKPYSSEGIFVTYQGGGISSKPSYRRWMKDVVSARKLVGKQKIRIFEFMIQGGIALLLFVRSRILRLHFARKSKPAHKDKLL